MITKENKETITNLLQYMQQEFSPRTQSKVTDPEDNNQTLENFYSQHFQKEFKIEELKTCMELLGCYKNNKEKHDYKNILNQIFQNNSQMCQIIIKTLELVKF